jgi:hypothetical protein
MATNSDRDIDWEIARLSGGLTAARRAVPAHQGSLRPSDWDLAEREEGPLSERGEALRQDLAAIEARKRPIVESIAPMSMEMEPATAAQSEPPAARKRLDRGANAFWTATAAGMSLLAVGLVVGLGLMPLPVATTPAPAAPAPASMAVVDEGVPLVTRPMVMLDPVFVAADPTVAAPIHAAPVAAAAPAARAAVAAVAPSPAAIAPRMVIPPLAAAPPVATTDISRPAVAVAISVAGRRAASCTADNDARSTMPVSVTFAPSGRVTTATVDGGPFAGTAVGSCIARALRGATVGPFDGAPVTVHSSVRIH